MAPHRRTTGTPIRRRPDPSIPIVIEADGRLIFDRPKPARSRSRLPGWTLYEPNVEWFRL